MELSTLRTVTRRREEALTNSQQFLGDFKRPKITNYPQKRAIQIESVRIPFNDYLAEALDSGY